ncbi:hypothetical protein GYMLUDRAFT_582284 [Collybiopsis luxurians FD-317 M1]|uniref:F-box domain-containing protein n=1 Tax=Collybiopsis luxurians FD-317 M1 TaxID=944289 RepID=A0A0D0CQR1_9AGAR|nr:hypothetical protein GYMLUDRAFT_582284 [Collybiopsis luxurians FD-317 M1]
MSSSFRSSVDIDARKIHEYSRSPHGLSERQLSEVRDLVLSVQDDLGWYDDEICRLESQLLQLKSRRERARKSQQSLRSLLSPIHRLPNELLIRIFVYVCQDISALPTFGLSVGPFYVSAVCARWRLLALSSSKLWSNFWVRIRSGSSQKLEEAVVLCLQRSKHQPLTLTLYVQSSESHSLFRTLFDYSIRWQRVMLFLDSEAARFFNGQEGFDFPALESVTVAANYHDVPVNLDIFIRAPKLHTLWPTNANIELNSVVLHQITDLMYNLKRSH